MLSDLFKLIACSVAVFLSTGYLEAQPADLNQTPTVSPVLSGIELPFSMDIELLDLRLPSGIHSGAMAEHHGKWLFIAGRTNGMHGFDNNDNNFPPSQQNTRVIVVDPACEQIYSRSLSEDGSGLSPHQVDLLSVTSPQFYQCRNTLYLTGGYGVDSSTGEFTTKDALTAIDVPGLIHWVVNPSFRETAHDHIRQVFHPIFRITGGYMAPGDDGLTLLVFGQDFEGFYEDNSNGIYSEQVRRFEIIDDGHYLGINIKHSEPHHRDPNFRRRDLNVVPFVKKHDGQLFFTLVAFSGVFTEAGGAWTVPVAINAHGHACMESPFKASTFKQGMNNYVCPTVGLFSENYRDMYTTLFGGITFGYFDNNNFTTSSELPFTNQVTTIRCDSKGHYTQYLMNAIYPTILSNGPHVGNPLLFGAGGQFVLSDGLPLYKNGVIKFDALPNGSTEIGYIVGGIQSTVPNTQQKSDSSASRYIFKVTLNKGGPV